jgi:hypothetical protein
LFKRDNRFRKKNALFKDGKIDDERFRSLRLARGVTVSVKKAYK